MSKICATLLVDPTDISTCKALVPTVDEVKLLREKHRIVGCRVSSVVPLGKQQKQKKIQLPIHLTWEEVLIGVKHGFLLLTSVSNESDTSANNNKESWDSFADALCSLDEKLKEQITKSLSICTLEQSVLSLFPSKYQRDLRIFEDLWLKGYYVTHGAKFGVDYLIYDGNPFETHAKAMILCIDYEAALSPLSIVGHGRMAGMVLKTLVYASVVADDTEEDTETFSSSKKKVVYFSLNHTLLVSPQQLH